MGLRDKLQKWYEELGELKPPRGLYGSAEDIDVDVYQYTDELIGTVGSYLVGKEVNSPKPISEDLEGKMEEYQAKLNEFWEYKHKHDELLVLLLENLHQDEG